MRELLLLLLPLAFLAGWRVSKKKLISSQDKQQQLSGNFVKGVNYLLSEEPDKALEVFLNYPDIDEYTAETFQLLGDSFRNRGEVDRALRVHQNLIARPNLSVKQKQKAMFSLGEDFYSAGMLDRAEGVFTELLENTQLNKHISKAAVCASLRTIYEQTQEWQKAIDATDCYKKSNKKDAAEPDSKILVAHYYCELAETALQQGKLSEVDTYIKKVKDVYKQSTRLMTLQGDIELHQKNYKPAIKKYLTAVKSDSRLLSMLFEKLEESALADNTIPALQKELLAIYKKKKDKTIYEKLLVLADKYQGTIAIDKLVEEELPNQKLNIESIYNSSEYIKSHSENISADKGLDLLNKSLSNYLKGVPAFRCDHCGYKMHDYLWRCPACQTWDSIDHA